MVGDENLIKEYATIQKTRDWGWTSVKNLRFVLPQVRTLSPSSVIDYGCGTSPLLQLLDVKSIKERRHYDPAVADYSASPTKQYDLLISIDVLEHIDELHLDEVLDHLGRELLVDDRDLAVADLVVQRRDRLVDGAAEGEALDEDLLRLTQPVDAPCGLRLLRATLYLVSLNLGLSEWIF